MKYLFLIVGVFYLLEVVYAFVKPRELYEIFSYNVPFFAFITFHNLVNFPLKPSCHLF